MAPGGTTFFKIQLARWPGSELIMDGYHLSQEMLRIDQPDCARPGGEQGVAGPTPLPLLARPTLDEALALLEAYRPQAKDIGSLEALITYLSERRAYLPNYKQRRAQRQYIGSAHAEKANDLLVARCQKHQGMHWREA